MTGRYQAYPEYIEINNRWVDSIPSHWEVTALKHVLSTPITDGPHLTPNFLDEGIPFVSAEAVSGGVINFEKVRGYISKEDDIVFSQKYKPQLHDVYMIKSGATTGVCAIVETNDRFNIWSPLAAMRCKDSYHPYFLLNYLRSDSFQKSVQLSWTFGTQQNIGMNTLENLSVCLPPFEEQETITQFLKHETKKIDQLITKQKKLIELLKEKRQAVVSHAVTKGLNPDAEMKDSGVEWLGKVPKHWQVKRLKQLLRKPFLYGANEAALDTNREHPRFIRITDMASDGTLKDETFRSLSPEIAAPYMLENNDILLARSGATVGKSFIYKKEFGDSCFAGYLIKASIKEKLFSPNLIYWFCQSDCYWKNIGGSQIQSTIQNVSAEKYGEIKIPIPPSSTEQDEICSYIEKKTSKIDDLISACITQIDLTNERKTALISAAVTGKIDVRYFKEEVNE